MERLTLMRAVSAQVRTSKLRASKLRAVSVGLSVVLYVSLCALFLAIHARAPSASAQPTPSAALTAGALDAFLTTPTYRDPDEGERRERDRVEVWLLESLERGDLNAKLCDGVRWLLAGRLKRSGGARAAFERDPTLRDISLIFYKVKTRVNPDLSGRYIQSRTPMPVARFSISREQALSLNNERLKPLLSGAGCVEQGRALINDLWVADEVGVEREAIAQMERARALTSAPRPEPTSP
jgi:hypothetical protein